MAADTPAVVAEITVLQVDLEFIAPIAFAVVAAIAVRILSKPEFIAPTALAVVAAMAVLQVDFEIIDPPASAVVALIVVVDDAADARKVWRNERIT
jgi:hypothetical protein